MNALKERGPREVPIHYEAINAISTQLLIRKQSPLEDGPAASHMQPGSYEGSLPHASPHRRDDDGSDMFLDPEFRSGCLVFTQFFRGRLLFSILNLVFVFKGLSCALFEFMLIANFSNRKIEGNSYGLFDWLSKCSSGTSVLGI